MLKKIIDLVKRFKYMQWQLVREKEHDHYFGSNDTFDFDDYWDDNSPFLDDEPFEDCDIHKLF